MSQTSRIRPQYKPQFVDGHENLPSKFHFVDIFHASDVSKQFYIASLPANDARNGGIRYAVAYWCMFVLTELSTLSNARGYFSLTHDGEAVEEDRDSILTEKQYFFRVEKNGIENRDYALIPSFQDFRFPHQNFPEEWKLMTTELSASDADRTRQGAEARDKSCRLTSTADGYEVAYLVPVSNGTWFDANAMTKYTPDGRGSIDNMSNSLVLRADVHRTFDIRAWVIIPDGNAWVSYVLRPGNNDPELLRFYHNVRISLERIPTEFLFARFAYAILDPKNANLPFEEERRYLFANAPQPRDLVYLAFKRTVAPSKSRSASSKRSRDGEALADGEAQNSDPSEWPSDSNSEWGGEARGRTLKRSLSDFKGEERVRKFLCGIGV